LSPFIHGIAAGGLLSVGLYAEAEQAGQRSLELQTDFLLGLWVRGLALSGLNRHDEGIVSLERAAVLSRAPIWVGGLGLGYGRAGRIEEARRLLGELEDRASRGEYVPAAAPLAINVGLGDLPGIRRELAAALAESTPPFGLRVTSVVFLDQLAADPEIARMLDALFLGKSLGTAP
jgi:tetratricopeptide (TPR) repeat protein